MSWKACVVLLFAVAAHSAVAGEHGASIDREESWIDRTGTSAIEIRLTEGRSDNDRVLFINSSSATIDIVDMNMTRIRTIKPNQSVDISESVAKDGHVAISVHGSQLIYLELVPGRSVIVSSVEEDAS